MGTLYVVSTPIGNLEDISLRALRVLRSVALIAAEDTREARKLLTHYDIHTRLVSANAHNERARIDPILAALAVADVALVSDAGTPTLSDPGPLLIAAAAEAGYSVTAVPGPGAVLTALALTGWEMEGFTFLGFLPRTGKARRAALAQVATLPWPLVLYEAPHRLLATLADVQTALGDRSCVVARELTKLYEEVRRETVGAALAHFAQTAPRGEFTLVIAGAAPPTVAEQAAHTDDVEAQARDRLALLAAEGQRSREAVAQVALELALPRRRVYALWLELAGER